MKKKLIILLLIIALLPTKVFASGLDNYKENDKQAVIYMFRGQGCGYCRAFLSFLASIVDEYGEYFKLVSYEVWEDATNAELLEKVATFNKEDLDHLGVPYVVIGEKVFRGYAADGSWDDDIKAAIMKQYDNPSYDVMKSANINTSNYKSMNFLETLESEELPEKEETKKTSGSGLNSTTAIFLGNALIVIASAAVVIFLNNNNTKKILDAMNSKETKKK